jgi:hypothetical protein
MSALAWNDRCTDLSHETETCTRRFALFAARARVRGAPLAGHK